MDESNEILFDEMYGEETQDYGQYGDSYEEQDEEQGEIQGVAEEPEEITEVAVGEPFVQAGFDQSAYSQALEQGRILGLKQAAVDVELQNLLMTTLGADSIDVVKEKLREQVEQYQDDLWKNSPAEAYRFAEKLKQSQAQAQRAAEQLQSIEPISSATPNAGQALLQFEIAMQEQNPGFDVIAHMSANPSFKELVRYGVPPEVAMNYDVEQARARGEGEALKRVADRSARSGAVPKGGHNPLTTSQKIGRLDSAKIARLREQIASGGIPDFESI